jgi:hypothetical protein
MAELSEKDLISIFGKDHREDLAESDRMRGLKEGERDKKALIANLGERKILGAYMVGVGVVMVWAAWSSAVGTAFTVHAGLGVAIGIAGVLLGLNARRKAIVARSHLPALS